MPLMPERSSTWSQCIGLPSASLLPWPRTSSVAPSFSAHATACCRSLLSRGLIVPAIAHRILDRGENHIDMEASMRALILALLLLTIAWSQVTAHAQSVVWPAFGPVRNLLRFDGF